MNRKIGLLYVEKNVQQPNVVFALKHLGKFGDAFEGEVGAFLNQVFIQLVAQHLERGFFRSFFHTFFYTFFYAFFETFFATFFAVLLQLHFQSHILTPPFLFLFRLYDFCFD